MCYSFTVNYVSVSAFRSIKQTFRLFFFYVLAPNPSSIEDKARLGAAPPVGGIADPLSDPDKGFYENLPFHGMQNPPNKVRSCANYNLSLLFLQQQKFYRHNVFVNTQRNINYRPKWNCLITLFTINLFYLGEITNLVD